ncbi:Lrp/AsnC family transcriptional regulator [Amphritea balenae]|uniref:siroheme decarboxylase n=1 Tax=Amphritea balenae TaxID=452629 RepID=A0A3P1SUT4_9GAMM|nr:Lrp/AsnC family transcriptional regulator [Amphritea balenae]RRC99912.1 Lrp/AsnC family transcriptional regulator [Amphritea balenae]GGK75022.1 protein NirD [Amphritea balenae]
MELTEQDRLLLNQFQQQLPASITPYADMAVACDMTEAEVLERLQFWQDEGVLSRVGGVLNHQKVGSSTLAALAVPDDLRDEMALKVNSFPQVNHNYHRTHHYNIWFVVTGRDEQEITQVLADIEQETGFKPLNLPMLQPFHLNLGFAI